MEWAIKRSMRNPLRSWERSDSFTDNNGVFVLGPNDRSRLFSLSEAGEEHRKALRTVYVGITLTLPLYVWSEVDTYKVGTVRDSDSTMHNLHKRDLTPDDFQNGVVLPDTLQNLNELGRLYRKTKDPDYFEEMKMKLPCGYLLLSDYDANYEVFINMFGQRKNHRLKEWKYTGEANSSSICNWVTTLPYMYDLLKFIGEIKNNT